MLLHLMAMVDSSDCYGLMAEEPYTHVYDGSTGRRWDVYRVVGRDGIVLLLSPHPDIGYLQLWIPEAELEVWRRNRPTTIALARERAAARPLLGIGPLGRWSRARPPRWEA